MQPKNLLRNVIILLSVFWFSACQKHIDMKEILGHESPKQDSNGFVENDMVLTWNENVSNVISKTAGPPPVLSRHFTMSQIAVHDALNSIKPKYKTYALLNTHEKDADADAAVASAAYWTLKNLNTYLGTLTPAGSLPLQTSGNDWEAWFATSMATIPDGAAKEAGIALGKKAAEAIMQKRADDNFAQARVTYIPIPAPETPLAPGVYRPTTSQAPVPAYHSGGLPLWSTLMKPFTITSNNQFRPTAPPSLTSDTYSSDYNEVKQLGARFGSTRNADQTHIANFWQEGPNTIWNRFARNAIQTKKVDAWRSARLLAIFNTAIFDGVLAAFDGLYYYQTWRPESAIRLGDNDENDQTTSIEDWLPFVTDIKVGPAPQTPTPPIPEYPNPNVATSAAAARILALFFETDKTDINLITQDVTVPGTSRVFTSFSQAHEEFFNSRIYAGFNFRYSLKVGSEIGDQVAHYVYEYNFKENN